MFAYGYVKKSYSHIMADIMAIKFYMGNKRSLEGGNILVMIANQRLRAMRYLCKGGRHYYSVSLFYSPGITTL
jgi:hypothetical protein